MPFSCKFQLNNGALKEDDNLMFIEYVDASFGKFHREKVELAKVMVNGEVRFISSNCPCFVSSKGALKFGDAVNEETEIGFFSANGEDIPYGKPYAILQSEKKSSAI